MEVTCLLGRYLFVRKIPVCHEDTCFKDTCYVRGRYLYQEEDPMSKEDTSLSERKTHFERKEKSDHITTVASLWMHTQGNE